MRTKASFERRRSFSRLLLAARVLGLAVVSAAVLLAGWHLAKGIHSGGYFQLSTIRYEGAARFSQAEFETALRREFDRDLLTLDLERVRELVESDRWVRFALVRRQLPDTLLIVITEREAIAVAAVGGDLLIVDVEGILLGRFGPDFQHLDRPILTGLVNGAMDGATQENARRVAAYLRVVEELSGPGADYTHEVSEISVEDLEKIAIIPAEDPVPVYVGAERYRARFETFLSQREVYLQLKEKYGLIEYVDVTYDNRVIFHTPAEAAAG